jgi:DNA-directed RNA polymerase subunit M/transcription elongation factor TFIIS
MQTLKTNRCPRCGGNIFIDEDSIGYYAHCLQCGYEQQIRELGKVQR